MASQLYAWDSDLPTDHIFLYELCLPQIRFYQTLDLSAPGYGEDWFQFYLGGEYRIVEFSNLVYRVKPTMLMKRQKPECDGCQLEVKGDEYSPESWPSLTFCYTCIWHARSWLVSQGLAEGNQFFAELCATEDEHVEGQSRVWQESGHGSSSFTDTWVSLGRK